MCNKHRKNTVTRNRVKTCLKGKMFGNDRVAMFYSINEAYDIGKHINC